MIKITIYYPPIKPPPPEDMERWRKYGFDVLSSHGMAGDKLACEVGAIFSYAFSVEELEYRLEANIKEELSGVLLFLKDKENEK